MEARVRTCVLLFSDQPLLYQAIAQQFSEQMDFELRTVDLGSGESEGAILSYHPRVVVIDLDPFFSDGSLPSQPCPAVVFLRRLQQADREMRLLLLASRLEMKIVHLLAELNIPGYLLKNDQAMLSLPDIVRAISCGACVYSRPVLQAREAASIHTPHSMLSGRQAQVLQTILAHPNLSYAGCAQCLGIRKSTFDTHLRAIFEKLGVNNLAAAIVVAAREGWIPREWLFPAGEETSNPGAYPA